MKLSTPSPAMIVASIALFVALGGTSVAAVSYARNAGKVDGKDAVSASSTNRKAAGNLVATNRSGDDRGKLPGKFVADVARSSQFGRAYEVADNQVIAPAPVATVSGVGTLTASCADQAVQRAGVEDPRSDIAFVNQSGGTINVARSVGTGEALVGALANGAGLPIAVAGSNTFFYHLQTVQGVNILINGVVRQDGRGAAAASCLVFGTVLRVE